jgi:hypothetical protein
MAQQNVSAETSAARTGGCLCGAVRYEVRGPLRDVLVSASTAANKPDLIITDQRGLRWIDSPHSEARARRGFCAECGSSLFWDPPGRETISISAGTLDDDDGLRVVSHWYVSQAGAYYDIPADGLPHHAGSGEGELP